MQSLADSLTSINIYLHSTDSKKINMARVIFSLQEILTHELETHQILLKISFCINLR